jgi:hypothetical protein
MARERALALTGEQRYLETTRKFLRFELQRGSPKDVTTPLSRDASAATAIDLTTRGP